MAGLPTPGNPSLSGGHWITVVDPSTLAETPRWVPDNYFPQTGFSSPDGGDNEPNFGGGLPTQRPGITFTSPDVGGLPTDITAPTNTAFDPAGNFTGPSTFSGGSATPSLWHTAATVTKAVLPNVIGGAFQLIAGNQAANASKDAAQIQAAETDKALALQKQMFDARLANLAPYRQTGGAALSSLANLMGLPAPTSAAPTAPGFSGQLTTPAGSSIPISPNGGTFGLPGPNFKTDKDIKSAPPPRGYTTIKAPTGQTYYVPPEHVQDAIAHGGTVVTGGGQ